MLRKRQNCEASKKSQKQAGGKAPERRRPLWTPSDGNAANGLFWLDFRQSFLVRTPLRTSGLCLGNPIIKKDKQIRMDFDDGLGRICRTDTKIGGRASHAVRVYRATRQRASSAVRVSSRRSGGRRV